MLCIYRYKRIMPYNKKAKKYAKRIFPNKYQKNKIVSRAKTQSLIKLVKSVSLKKAETKHTHQILENNQLYHNVPFMLMYNILYTSTGVTDPNSGLTNFTGRVGNEVIGRGISIKLWLANKLDRPNVMYRVIIYKYTNLSGQAVQSPGHPYDSQGTSNYMIRDLNTDKFKIVKQKIVNLQVGSSNTGAQQGVTVGDRKEAHKMLKFWIPLRNRIVKYDSDDLVLGWNYACSIVPYDSYGTLTTDNISSVAFNVKFYYKDV